MSNALFPTPQPNTGWNWKLPLKVYPSYSTLVQTPANNRGELRISLAEYPLWNFDMEIPYILGSPDTINGPWQQVVGFYGQMKGMADDWLFDWPGNDTINTPEVVAEGDDTSLVFALTHKLGGMVELIQNFQAPPTIYVGGVVADPATYGLDSVGNVAFNAGEAPAAGAQVSWKGSWYHRCTFLSDDLQDLQWIRGEGINGFWSLKSLKFKSVLL